MELQRKEVINLPSFSHYKKQNLEIILYLFNKFERSKWKGLRNLTEIESCKGLLKDMAKFLTLQTRLGHNATR